MNKKLITLLLTLSFSFSLLLTGCGNSDPNAGAYGGEVSITHQNTVEEIQPSSEENVENENEEEQTAQKPAEQTTPQPKPDVKPDEPSVQEETPVPEQPAISNSSLGNIPAYTSEPYVVLNNNIPSFDESEINTNVFEIYSEFDSLGRCGVAYANICKELMPTESRESISSVTPSGWDNNPYDWVDGGYIYNRCHLIGFQLAGENANKLNLVTGTRYMNVTGMLPFENMIDDYVEETNNHVLYRVTPIYTGNNLVVDGVVMEAYSVEDDGDGICFNIFCYNVEPGCEIDYATGENWANGQTPPPKGESSNTVSSPSSGKTSGDYILNTNSKKFHTSSCSYGQSTSDKNKKEFSGSRDDLISQGYEPCGSCKP